MTNDLFSWKDANHTVKVFIVTLLVFIVSLVLGDAVTLWLLANILLVWPLAYQKKRSQIEKIIDTINK